MIGHIYRRPADSKLEHHLANGDLSVVKDSAGLTARVAGATGITQPRTPDTGAALAVRFVQPVEAGEPLSTSHQAIQKHGTVFITLNGLDHHSFPTSVQFSTIPIGAEPPTYRDIALSAATAVADPDHSAPGNPPYWCFSAMVSDTCDRLPNWSRRAMVAAGHFATQGSVVKIAGAYPSLTLPV